MASSNDDSNSKSALSELEITPPNGPEPASSNEPELTSPSTIPTPDAPALYLTPLTNSCPILDRFPRELIIRLLEFLPSRLTIYTRRGEDTHKDLWSLHKTHPRFTPFTRRKLFSNITLYGPDYNLTLASTPRSVLSHIRRLNILNICQYQKAQELEADWQSLKTSTEKDKNLRNLFTLLRRLEGLGILHENLKVTVAFQIPGDGSIGKSLASPAQLARIQGIYKACISDYAVIWRDDPACSSLKSRRTLSEVNLEDVRQQFKTTSIDMLFFVLAIAFAKSLAPYFDLINITNPPGNFFEIGLEPPHGAGHFIDTCYILQPEGENKI